MNTPTKCPYCLSTDLKHEVEACDPQLPAVVYSRCNGCHAYTFDGYDVGPLATEVQMATGWHGNTEDLTSFSPFAPVPRRENVAIHSYWSRWWWLR